ncbi:FAD-dependent oxidoreductase [Cytophaga aurantiaca]|uniref:FAD-dependent oxidoreductase n=1 Tax=Cytophaga aurantiaca TaxID=29530 RepID=UPI00036DA50B|nr:NAD(P)/FAD-dependent oxidoreductase [Cytophaga aurantiaca]
MKEEQKIDTCWTVCVECQGRGKVSKRSRKYVRLRHQQAMDAFEKNPEGGAAPVRPKSSLQPCGNCDASGLTRSSKFPIADTNYPSIAIIGGGIGGMALAVACLHRGIPFTLYERDRSFDARAQGYGLTLQQASRAMKGFGIMSLKEGVYSTNHVVHNTAGDVISEWGMRNRMDTDEKKNPKRTNIHIARQALRASLLEQLGGKDMVQWGHQLTAYKERADGGVELNFNVNGELKSQHADLVVGADGIRSVVRSLLIGEEVTPLRYLDCIVILGICPMANLEGVESVLLDGETVFQTVNGTERIYMMPYDEHTVMWQLSFPMTEKEAQDLSAQGPQALKDEACRRTQWHNPVPQIVAATPVEYISGYPVYDRELITPELLAKSEHVTLIGDAAHPMSPFKGQGANQALLDALALARGIVSACRPLSNWRAAGIRKSVLNDFESEMLERSASKVKDSAEAVQLLHSKVVLREGNAPKGRSLK